jgi:fructose-bisphosphate aldolase class I
MILPGLEATDQSDRNIIAQATVKCFLKSVPAAVPGIAFLSGGQSPELASTRLNEMNKQYQSELPWALTFSFGRALQQPALELWRGDDANITAAQKALYHRVECNRAANMGHYTYLME